MTCSESQNARDMTYIKLRSSYKLTHAYLNKLKTNGFSCAISLRTEGLEKDNLICNFNTVHVCF